MKKTQKALNTLLICLLPNVGTHRYWGLVQHCGSEKQVLTSDPDALPIVNKQARLLLHEYQRSPNSSSLMISAEKIITQIDRSQSQSQTTIISIEDDDYPTLLKTIHEPPPLLYCKGNTHALHLPQLAMVGSRHATHQGLRTSGLFAQHLAKCGFSITSGLALGVDSAAHQAVLNLDHTNPGTGTTIAVMATGIDTIYPRQHQTIAERIVANGGALVTEFPPNTPPKAGHFPRRNRIISGLSMGVIVVEAAIKSGSLITAKYAMEQGREVFAIPGSIHNPQAKGCHQLIKQGASLIESSDDIVEQLSGMMTHHRHELQQSMDTTQIKTKPSTLTPEDEQLLAHLEFSPTSIDQLIEATQLSNAEISESLVNLEINGWIKRSAWGYERV